MDISSHRLLPVREHAFFLSKIQLQDLSIMNQVATGSVQCFDNFLYLINPKGHKASIAFFKKMMDDRALL